MVLDEQGDVVERRDYLPYGSERLTDSAPNAPKTDHKFTGKELDSETGLYYYGARYYDPVIGRFTSIDPLVLDEARMTNEDLLSILESPQKLNAYTYALNNPLRYLDPFGESLKNLFQGTIKMFEGGMKVVLGYAGLVRSPGKAVTKKAAGSGFVYKGAVDIKDGFKQVVTDSEVNPVLPEKMVNSSVRMIMTKKLSFIAKRAYKFLYDFDSLSQGAGKLGNFLDETASKLGQENNQQQINVSYPFHWNIEGDAVQGDQKLTPKERFRSGLNFGIIEKGKVEENSK